jgi:hypothetical protein
MKRLILVTLVLISALTVANGQPGVFTISNFKILTGFDVNTAASVLSSFTAVNNLACTAVCKSNSDCVLAVIKSNNLCNLFSSSALSQVVSPVSGSTLYQKQVNG